jgi:hypothetical protein
LLLFYKECNIMSVFQDQTVARTAKYLIGERLFAALAIFSIPYVFEGLPDWLFAVCMIMAPLALASAWRIHHLHKKGRLDSEVEWVKLLVDHVYREAQWHRTISATKVFLHGHGFDLWLGVTQILGLGILVGAAILFGLAMNANSAMDEAHEAAEWCVVIAAGASTWPFLTTVLRFLLRSPLSTMDKALCAIGFAPPLYLWYFMAGQGQEMVWLSIQYGFIAPALAAVMIAGCLAYVHLRNKGS